MRTSRTRWWIGLAVAAALGGVPALGAQQPDSSAGAADSIAQQQAYDTRRASLVKQLHETQDQLSQLRSQRVQLEAQIDNALAAAMERRAKLLLLSTEQNALLQLDTTLAAAQDNMQAQRDRMQALGDAVRRRTGAVLVVFFRADSTPASALGGLELRVDNAATTSRAYTPVAADAIQHGAVDELYRSSVLPTAHLVTVTATIAGQPVTQQLNVTVQSQTVTYVQFTAHDGQVTSSTWTSQGTTPF